MTSNEQTWVFGYGSLIYKVDFPFIQRRPASITGWQRRFWQGSHDHRGTPNAPGRVVTLIPCPDSICRGMAYLIDHTVFEHLDHREKNGYQRHPVSMTIDGENNITQGVTYVAREDNHAYLGPAKIEEVASHIAGSSGPSGSNTEYVLKLAHALRELDEHDPHVHALETLLTT